MLEKELTYLGFNEKEAKVYIAALQLSKATASQIASFSKLNRATTYLYLRGLISRGLISSFEQFGRVYFVAEKPEKIQRIIEARNNEVKKQEEHFIQLLPELNSIYNLIKSKPQIRFFEGREGLLSMQQEVLEDQSEIVYGFYCIDAVYEVFPKILDTYSKERVNLGIKSKIIYTSRLGKKYFKDDAERLRERRFVPFDQYPFSSDIAIYDNKVLIASLRGELVGMIIKNKQIADSLKLLFDLAWDGAKKYN